MKFFVPGRGFETAWERMRQACGAPVDNRPIYSITHDDDKTEVGVTVGEDGVIAIIPGQPFFIFREASRRAVPVESVTEMAFFEDD